MSDNIEKFARELVMAGVEDPASIGYKLKQMYGLQANPKLAQEYRNIKCRSRRERRALEQIKRKKKW